MKHGAMKKGFQRQARRAGRDPSLVAIWVAIACAIALVGGIVAPALAHATEDDHAAAERLVADLEHDSAHRVLTQDAVTHAKQALERSLRMRQAGDDVRAREVDALAREWAELGRDLAQTADTEARAGALRSAANDAGAHAERERALLEESIMRNARMKAEIESAQREETQAPTHTSAVGKITDAGTTKSTSTSTSTSPKTNKTDGGAK